VTEGRTLNRDYKDVKRPGGPAFSGWVGFLAGLAVGLTVALGVFLHDRDVAIEVPHASAARPPASAQATDDFVFPDVLRKGVPVPMPEKRESGQAATRPDGDVILEAGSFKQRAEAEQLQGKLARFGVDAKIQRFAVEDEIWYRVHIGPIATVGELQAIRAKLSDAGVEAEPVTPPGTDPPP
jgi:hypothetical protein